MKQKSLIMGSSNEMNLLELAHHLRQEYLFVSSEREHLQHLNEKAVVDEIQHLLEDHKYVLGVSLDISKAFDSAWWPLVLRRLCQINCPRNIYKLLCDYLKDRRAILCYGQHQVIKPITKGCPQGSVIGPLLWNITFDAFLSENFGQTSSYAYADDVFLLLGGRSRSDLEGNANNMLQHVSNWGVKHKLYFNPVKTKAIVFNKSGHPNLYRRPPHIKMQGNTIKVEQTLKYLGVILDFRLSWDRHIDYITNKTGLVMQSFSQVARRDWGLSSDAMSIIYDSIYIPVITYACGTWGWATRKVHPKRKLVSSQRRALLLITRAYKTTSNSSLQVLAKKPPIDTYRLSILQKRRLRQLKWGGTVEITSCTINYNDIEWPSSFKETRSPGETSVCKFTSSENADIHVFTDGSRINDNVGSSFVAYINNIEVHHQMYRLDSRCTVFQAELYAIGMAIDYINHNYSNIHVHIHTDSRSALDLLQSNKLHPLADYIKNATQSSECTFTITWIRAHQGDTGNERADSLAKDAALNGSLQITYNKISLRSLHHLLWNDTIELWQNTWNHNSEHITYKFIPDLRQFLKTNWHTPDYCTLQIFSNHGKYASYLARFTNRSSERCPICDTEDGALHYLFDCVILDRDRLELQLLLQELGVMWPCHPSDIWHTKEIFYAFRKLARQINFVTHKIINS
ncbi:uncharacterized protein LOC111620327 [Centruroides sculpturatus]|uniref:uncharacterized protein LOC111620327 n=1 Tax=Centruroides sculpturatus TaxID=218467 RepID=UPI000C6CCFB3|nr:uncharacterized protein LOC111620327 [Centruroides sculpturatus]